jgi:hypothetical protein
MVFGLIKDRDGSDYAADIRSMLKRFNEGLRAKGMQTNSRRSSRASSSRG